MAQPFVEPCGRGVIDAEPCPRELGREVSIQRRRMVLAGCVLASSMAFIDGSALTVALPKLRAAFGADLASVQWVLSGYLLALASLTLIGGALADDYGKARMLSVGCLVFGAASVGCALAPTFVWLIFARVLQGIAAAFLTPASLALIGATYPKKERNRAIAVWAAASSLTTAAGPILGGWLTDTFSWQAVFLINPPIAVIVVGLVWTFAPNDRRKPHRFDVVGAAIIAVALGTLAWALSELGRNEPIRHLVNVERKDRRRRTLGVVGLVVYVLWERVSEHPMTPPYLARNRNFFGLNVATLLIYAGISIMFFLLPFDLIDRRGLPSTDAGLAFLPFTLGVGLLSRPLVASRTRSGPGDAYNGPGRSGPRLCLDGARTRWFPDIRRDRPDGAVGRFVCHAGGTFNRLSHVEREQTDEGLASGIKTRQVVLRSSPAWQWCRPRNNCVRLRSSP